MTSKGFTFDKFSRNNFYDQLNARLVDMAEVGSDQRIVDLACGTGSVTQLILERLRGARDSVIIAIDHSATALRQAMENLKDARNSAVQFVQSRVDQVSEAVNKNLADTIFFCNAIHYVPDKDALLVEVAKSIKPGGKFVFNTSFFEGSHPPETLLFYRKWMFKAIRILRREYGLSPVKSEKVEARKHLTPGQYRLLLENNGFIVARQEIDKVLVPIDGWLDISEFEDFISGTLPGVPLDQASDSLKRGIHETFAELKLEYVPRNWLDVIALKA